MKSFGGAVIEATIEADLIATETLIGAVTETAPATDTASSGQNGRLQRIAQRLTALIAFFASGVGGYVNLITGQIGIAGGAGAVGATVPRVTLASDDPLVALAGAPTTGAKSNVNDGASSVPVLAANASRKGATFWNDSTAILYLDLSGGTATATSCSVKIAADGYFELPDNGKRGVYTGLITGIWASDQSGAVRVTEFT